ncbi:MAG TPA: 4Fe-4S binding protein [Polyangiaceae bacterium]
MNDKLTRRRLFGLPEPASEKAAERPFRAGPGSFSLDGFYARRQAGGQSSSSMPQFEIRAELPVVETTRIGTPELQSEAVERDLPPLPAQHIDGVVRIEPKRCLAWQRSFCSVCSERCPEPGAIVCEVGKPRVVASACTGCGICVQVCPAPVNAFEVVPRPGSLASAELESAKEPT